VSDARLCQTKPLLFNVGASPGIFSGVQSNRCFHDDSRMKLQLSGGGEGGRRIPSVSELSHRICDNLVGHSGHGQGPDPWTSWPAAPV